MVQERAAWIGKQQAALRSAPELRFEDGGTIAYLGRQVPMVFDRTHARRITVRFDGSGFRVSLPTDLPTPEHDEKIRIAIIDWYRDRASEHLPTVVDRWWPKFGRGGTAEDPDPQPAPPLGKLRCRRHPALQLACDDARRVAHRLHRRPRTGSSDAHEPLEGLLGSGLPDHSGRSGPPETAAGNKPGVAVVAGYSSGEVSSPRSKPSPIRQPVASPCSTPQSRCRIWRHFPATGWRHREATEPASSPSGSTDSGGICFRRGDDGPYDVEIVDYH